MQVDSFWLQVAVLQGMGGQIENYFGLWIASDFEHGHSKAHPLCSTFGSPRLSKVLWFFPIHEVLCWGNG